MAILAPMTVRSLAPSVIKRSPAASRLIVKPQFMNNHVIITIRWDLASADITSTGYVRNDSEVGHPSSPSRDLGLHRRSPIDIPHHPSTLPTRRLIPRKGKHVPVRPVHVGNIVFNDTMFLRVFTGEEAPVQARMVDAIAVPGLKDVDFAVGRPGEGILRKQPEGRPDA